MTPITKNALLSGLVMAVSFSVFADEANEQRSANTDGTYSSTYSTLSAPVNETVATTDISGQVEPPGRSSADSMHPRADAIPHVADDYQVDSYRNTGE